MAHEQIGHFSRLSHNFGCIVHTKIRKGPQEIIHIRLIFLHLVFYTIPRKTKVWEAESSAKEKFTNSSCANA